MNIEKSLIEKHLNNRKFETSQRFKQLVQKDEYVGDLYSICYETAKIIIHDSSRKRVGGIPSLSFLIATRIDPEKTDEMDFKAEDSSLILLRVMDGASLPQDNEAERIRVETAQRVNGETETHWDSEKAMDAKTRVYLGYAGIECRIIGTFFLEEKTDNPEAPLF